MTNGATAGAAAAAAAHAAKCNALKAFGPIVKVVPSTFSSLVAELTEPIVVHARSGLFTKKDRFLCPYRGFFLFTVGKGFPELPDDTEIIEADSLWIPDA